MDAPAPVDESSAALVARRRRPDSSEAAAYYYAYIELVPAGDICTLLAHQRATVLEYLRGITEEQSRLRYAPGKWSVREVVAHLADTERLFAFRGFWFARGFESPLPSFDQSVAATSAAADTRLLTDLADEFKVVRQASEALFRSLHGEAWDRRGVASNQTFTVRAFAYLAEGHVRHHLNILHERYLPMRYLLRS